MTEEIRKIDMDYDALHIRVPYAFLEPSEPHISMTPILTNEELDVAYRTLKQNAVERYLYLQPCSCGCRGYEFGARD